MIVLDGYNGRGLVKPIAELNLWWVFILYLPKGSKMRTLGYLYLYEIYGNHPEGDIYYHSGFYSDTVHFYSISRLLNPSSYVERLLGI